MVSWVVVLLHIRLVQILMHRLTVLLSFVVVVVSRFLERNIELVHQIRF